VFPGYHSCLTCADLPQVTTGERSEAEYNRLWETNVVGTFLISKRLAPLMNKGALFELDAGLCQVRVKVGLWLGFREGSAPQQLVKARIYAGTAPSLKHTATGCWVGTMAEARSAQRGGK